MVAIEMNPRVSRSSALASKATGFPIAKIAAKLALGYRLDEIPNDITRVTPASFEPTIDYIVVKIPRWNFEKFPQADRTLTTQMKSVGEAMAIGRTFKEAFLKGIRSLELGKEGFLFRRPQFDDAEEEGTSESRKKTSALRRKLVIPTDRRMWALFRALDKGWDVEKIHELTNIDPWFLQQFKEIVELRKTAEMIGLRDMSHDLMRTLKRSGFGDRELADILGVDEAAVRERRNELKVKTAFKRIDTCAAEFESFTPYMYSSFEDSCEAEPTDKQKIIILGSGPNRIGQGIEFDYCCCHAVFGFKKEGFETVMVNCNPETVSTDYDTADRLYFEPLTFEDVMAIIEREREGNVDVSCVVQFGGQTPLKLALALQEAGVTILGTSPDSIDLAEDRQRFNQLLWDLGIPQPSSGTAISKAEAREVAAKVGFPVVVRPSYVLGGRAMAIVYDVATLDRYMSSAVDVSHDRPILIDRFLEHAKEVDVDASPTNPAPSSSAASWSTSRRPASIRATAPAWCRRRAWAIATCRRFATTRRRIAKALKVIGLMNVQYAIKDDTVYVLEVNPRASRTVPYLSKASGIPLAQVAARVMTGKSLAELGVIEDLTPAGVFVKSPVFPFVRFPGVDTILGPEMKSTGEVMGGADSFGMAFAKAMLGAGQRLPEEGAVCISVNNEDKAEVLPIAQGFAELGFKIIATRGTAAYFRAHGVECSVVFKVNEGRPSLADEIVNRTISLVVNTPHGRESFFDDKAVRRAAMMAGVPCITTITGAAAALEAIRALRTEGLDVRALQDYYAAVGAEPVVNTANGHERAMVRVLVV